MASNAWAFEQLSSPPYFRSTLDSAALTSVRKSMGTIPNFAGNLLSWLNIRNCFWCPYQPIINDFPFPVIANSLFPVMSRVRLSWWYKFYLSIETHEHILKCSYRALMALAIAKPGKAQLDWKVCRTPADPFFFLDEKGVGWGSTECIFRKN